MSGADIAAEVAAALAEAGAETGTGAPLYCTLKRPGDAAGSPSEAEAGGDGAPTYHEVTAVQDMRRIRDQSGMLTGEVRAVLMVDATGVAPLKSDLVAVGVRQADVDADTQFTEIANVSTTAPGGVAVLYEVELAG